MKALRLHGPQDLRLDDIPEPSTAPGTVKIKVEWCGVCGSDLHLYSMGPVGSDMSGKTHPITKETGPTVLGHEFAGTVVEVGSGDTSLVIGDKVAVEPILYDGTCHWCHRGDYNLCDKMGFVGIDGWGGGFSEYVVLPYHMAHRLPGGVDTDLGALVEPLAVAWTALRRSRSSPGDTSLVLGAGPIGLALVLGLRATGSSLIVASDPAKARRELAARFGADVALDPTVDDVTDLVREKTAGLGAHTTFDASGVKATLDTALHAVRKRGTAVNLALWEQEVGLNPTTLVFNEVDYTASLAYYQGVYAAVIAAITHGTIDAGQMITKRVRLDDAIDGAFGELMRNRDTHVKVLVHP